MGRYRVAGASMLVLWLVSLVLPAAHFTPIDADVSRAPFAHDGLWFLLGGWMGILHGQFAWLANPALVVTALWLGFGERPPLSVAVALPALGLTAFLFLGQIVPFEHGDWRVAAFGPGLWFWLAALLVPAALCMWEARLRLLSG